MRPLEGGRREEAPGDDRRTDFFPGGNITPASLLLLITSRGNPLHPFFTERPRETV
jgi:hypothetical protein